MKYQNRIVKTERVEELLNLYGISPLTFSRSLWGEKSHNSLNYFDIRPDVKVSTLVKMAEIIGCSVEDILIKSDGTSDNPTVNGNNNVVNSNYVNTDIAALKAELNALKLVLEEKNKRVEDLIKANDTLNARLDMVLQLGHNKDTLRENK